jgi:ATP-dependent protease HslVU (ClpYQ) peptidase subunit
MFTRLEDRVRTLTDDLIDDRMAALKDWKAKRTWNILSKRKDRMAFMDRVALLTETNGSDYVLIDRYYRQRNNIGHGGTFTITISIPTVVADMKRLFKDLED